MKIIVQLQSGQREKHCMACGGSNFIESATLNERDGCKNRWFVCVFCERVGSFSAAPVFDPAGNLVFNVT